MLRARFAFVAPACGAAAVSAVLALGGCSKGLSVDPAHGTYTGGDTVTVHSNGLFPKGAGGIQVWFGKKKAPYVAILSEDEAEVKTPTGDADSTVDVEIDLPDGRRFGIPHAFQYVDTSAGNVWGNKVDGGAKPPAK